MFYIETSSHLNLSSNGDALLDSELLSQHFYAVYELRVATPHVIIKRFYVDSALVSSVNLYSAVLAPACQNNLPNMPQYALLNTRTHQANTLAKHHADLELLR